MLCLLFLNPLLHSQNECGLFCWNVPLSVLCLPWQYFLVAQIIRNKEMLTALRIVIVLGMMDIFKMVTILWMVNSPRGGNCPMKGDRCRHVDRPGIFLKNSYGQITAAWYIISGKFLTLKKVSAGCALFRTLLIYTFPQQWVILKITFF